MAALLATSTAAQAAEFIATEVAWNGSASEGWIADKLAGAGFDPIDYPCEECGADAGEECRPYCTGVPGHAAEAEGDER